MPHLSCGVKCSRVMLVVLNIIFLLFGFAIWGLGIYVKFDGNFKTIVAAYNITEALGGRTMGWIGIIMIILGIITAGLAVFGCLGAGYKNRLFLYTYAVILTLIIFLEFASVVVTLQFRNDLWQSYDSGYKQVFQDAYLQNQTQTIDLIEQLERQFQCCGVDSYVDYIDVHHLIPMSCYPNQTPIGPPFITGCTKAILSWVWNELPIIAAVLGSILFFEIFGIVSSLVLGVAISHSSQTDTYDEH